MCLCERYTIFINRDSKNYQFLLLFWLFKISKPFTSTSLKLLGVTLGPVKNRRRRDQSPFLSNVEKGTGRRERVWITVPEYRLCRKECHNIIGRYVKRKKKQKKKNLQPRTIQRIRPELETRSPQEGGVRDSSTSISTCGDVGRGRRESRRQNLKKKWHEGEIVWEESTLETSSRRKTMSQNTMYCYRRTNENKGEGLI